MRARTSLRIDSSTSSIERPVESTYTASGACVRGASARVRSRSSRSRIWWRNGLAIDLHLGGAAPHAFLCLGVQKNFQIGIRKNNRADIAAFHHHVILFADGPLLFKQCAPDTRNRRHQRCRPGNLRRANGFGNILAVQHDAGSVHFEVDARSTRQLLHAMHIGRVELLAQCPQRHRAVHRTAIDVGETQTGSQTAGDGTLARCRRAVNRDHNSHAGSSVE